MKVQGENNLMGKINFPSKMEKKYFFSPKRFCSKILKIYFHFSEFEGLENLKDSIKHPATAWDLQEGYESNDPFTYPFRISGAGENGGLKFQIWRKIEEVKAIKTPVKGFKLVIHLPCELPNFDQQYFRFPLEKSATLIIHPSMTVNHLNIYLYSKLHCLFFFRLQKV
jgi:hypothetical protein